VNGPAAPGGGGPGPGGGSPTAPARASFAGSKSSITVGRNRSFVFTFRGTPGLTGTAGFRSVGSVEVSRKRRVTLATKRFTVPHDGRARLRIKLSKRSFRILQRNRRVRATITLKNTAERTGQASKTITLKAPKRKRR